MLVLSGIAIIIIGFALRVNPLLVVTVAALASAAAAGHGPVEVVAMIGKAFVDARFLAVPFLVLPTIGLLERAGLRVRARAIVQRLRRATTGRVLIGYLALRQITAALGLISLGGHAQMYFGSLTTLIPPMKNGKLRAMAVSGEKRTPALPDVPTFTQAGVPNFDVRLWYGLLAPAATPKDVVERVNSVITGIINTPELKEALAKQGMDALLMSPAQFGALMRTDFDRYAKIIKTANIKVDN